MKLHGYAEIAATSSEHWDEPVGKERCRKWASEYGLPIHRRMRRVWMFKDDLISWLNARDS